MYMEEQMPLLTTPHKNQQDFYQLEKNVVKKTHVKEFADHHQIQLLQLIKLHVLQVYTVQDTNFLKFETKNRNT